MSPSQRRPPRRVLLGVLSFAFVLLPAAGIAYLGAVSYREDQGLVAAKLDEQFRAAAMLAGSLEAEVRRTLDGVARVVSGSRASLDLTALRQEHELAAFPFHITRDGRLDYPAAEPLRRRGPQSSDFLSRAPRTCPERGFDTCILTLRTARRRVRQLDDARRLELGACAASVEACQARPRSLDAARRSYVALSRHDDTGPEALVGLGRLALRARDKAQAMKYYQALHSRFGTRLDDDGVAYQLIADLGLAEAAGSAEALLGLYRALLAPTYEAPTPLLDQLADELRTRLAGAELDRVAQAELAELDARLLGARDQARYAAALAGEVDEMARTAVEQPQGRPALTAPERTVIYRREADGTVIGVIVDMAMLEQAAARIEQDLSRLAAGTRAVIERPGDAARRAAHTRTLASTGFGPLLPHLSLALVNDRALTDPLDAIIESRGRRHLAITGGLVALLLIGLVATIRGAARERELARLKSDFVSTVSHELKTPLTSIRMFGEMLQQGVAGNDREREARYHAIIVKESQRLGLLIANLLDYSQIERGTRRYSRKPEGAADMVRDAVATFQRFREEPVDIRVGMADDAAESAELLVDREVVVQSLLNLLANAVKYGAQPIEVTVAVTVATTGAATVPAGEHVILSVTDHGPGIPASEHERIFREFYRSPQAYSSGAEGTGLGLALVKRHVEAQGGEVSIDSEPGRGATFALRFPRC